MFKLYSYGYQKGRLADIDRFVAQGAIIADIRAVPYSKEVRWSKASLKERYGDRYRWLRALGNRNYKVGGVYHLVNEELGFQQLRALLERQPVVLMCVCWDYTVCHRTAIAVVAESRWPELEWFSLAPGFDLFGEWIVSDPQM